MLTPGGVWSADFQTGVLWRLSPGAGAPERITSNGEPRDLAVLGDRVYVGADGRKFSGVISTFDAITGVREDSIDLLACAMASGEGVVWAAGCPFVQRLSTDERPLRTLRQRFLPFRSPATVENSRIQFRELAVGAGSLWVLGDALDRRLWRLDARTGRVEATIRLGFPPTSIAVADGTAWITDNLHDRVVPVDASDNALLTPVAVGSGASGVAAGARRRLGREHDRRHRLPDRPEHAPGRGDDRRRRPPPRHRRRPACGLGDRVCGLRRGAGWRRLLRWPCSRWPCSRPAAAEARSPSGSG